MDRAFLRAMALGLSFGPLPASATLLDWPRADEAADYLSPQVMAEARPHWTTDRRDPGAAWGGFLVWPAITIGAAFDSNPYQRGQGRKGQAGLFVAPRALAERDSGVHSTIAYVAADATLFPAETRASRITGRAGVIHDWAVDRDTLLRLQQDISRRIDPFDSIGTAALRQDGLITRTDLRSTASLQQTWSSVFAVVSGEFIRSSLGSSEDGRARRELSDASGIGASGRVGYRFTADLFAFGEAAANWHVLDAGSHSAGTRAVVGLGADRLGLLQGEIFAGWQHQTDEKPAQTVSGPVFGGRVGWSPHPTWTLLLEADERFGTATVGTPVDPLGTATRETAGVMALRYTPTPLWTSTASLGAREVDYVATPRKDRLLFALGEVDYAWARGITVTGSAEFDDLRSSIALASYNRAVARLGATYTY